MPAPVKISLRAPTLAAGNAPVRPVSAGPLWAVDKSGPNRNVPYETHGPYFVVRSTSYNPGGSMWVVHHHGPIFNGKERGNKGGPTKAVMADVIQQIWAQAPPALNGIPLTKNI